MISEIHFERTASAESKKNEKTFKKMTRILFGAGVIGQWVDL